MRALWLLAALAWASTAAAQSDRWTATGGPAGGTVRAVYAWPERGTAVVTLTGAHSYLSDTSLRSWRYLTNARYFGFAGADTVASASPPQYSVDGGATWIEAPLPDSVSGRSVAIHRETGRAVLVSNDGIWSWRLGEAAYAFTRTDGMRWASAAGSVVIVSPANSGLNLAMSEDGGATWETVALGSSARPRGHARIAAGQVWMVGSHNNRTGLFTSPDQGRTWSRHSWLPCFADDLLAVIDDQAVLSSRATLYSRPLSGGPCEEQINLSERTYLTGVRSSGHPGQASVLGAIRLMAARSNLHVSRDQGANWEIATLEGIGSPSVTALFPEPRTGTWWAGTASDGLYRSDDGGISWTSMGFRGEPNLSAITTAGSPDEVWLGTTASGLHRSADGGRTWTLLPNPELGGSIPHGFIDNLAYNAATGDVLTTWSLWDVFSSQDGRSFSGLGVPAGSRIDPPIWGTHLAPSGALYVSMLYPLANDWEILRWPTPASSTYESVGGKLPAPAEQILESASGALFAGISFPFDRSLGPAGVYRLDLPDTTWRAVLPDVNPLEIVETPDGAIWVASWEGVFRSADGFLFEPAEAGLPDCTETLAYDPFWRELLAGTCRGVYSIAIPSTIRVDPDPIAPSRLSLFPNPAAERATLLLDHPGGELTVHVFDVLGRRLSHSRSWQGAGEVRHPIDLADFPDGVYYVQTESAGAVSVVAGVVVR